MVRFEHETPRDLRTHRYTAAAKPGRAGTDDHEIADASLIDVLIEPETVGNLRIRRMSQHDIAAADHDRDVSDTDLKAGRAGPGRRGSRSRSR